MLYTHIRLIRQRWKFLDIIVSLILLIIILFSPFIIINLLIFIQKLIMKLPCRVLHFVPVLFFTVLFVYEYLRSRGVIVYYSDIEDASFSAGVICLFILFCFLISLVTLIAVYIRDRKKPSSPAGKKRKYLAGAAVILLIAFSGHYVYKMLSYDYGQDTSVFYSQKINTISDHMFDRLHSGEYDVHSVFIKGELLDSIDCNEYPDEYYAVKYCDFNSIGFWDEHTVMICNGGFLHSASGYLVTDGTNSFHRGQYDNPETCGYSFDNIYIHEGYENIYWWIA